MQLFKMSSRQLTAVFIGAFTFLSIGTFAQEKETTPQTVKGEVIDLSCYMDHGAKGEGHKGCAESCIKRGLPAGLLTADGQLYLLTENHSKEKAYTKLSKYAAEQVSVTGTVADKNGMKAISVDDIKSNK